MGRLVLRALGWGLIGFFVVPIAVLVIGMIVYQFDSRCGLPGDSGGCEMGIFAAVIASALPGAIVFFLFVLVRGLVRPPPAGS